MQTEPITPTAARAPGGRGPTAGDSLMSESSPTHPASILDWVVPVSFAGWSLWLLAGALATLIAALALRLMRLDTVALDAGEAAHAYNAWVLFRGQPAASGEAIPDQGAFLQLLEGFAFFLFGATDVVARLVPVTAGLLLAVLPLTMRRWLGAPAAFGTAALIAISPTLVLASRIVTAEIVIAALALAGLALIVHLGSPGLTSARFAAIALGTVVGAAFASGPSSLSVALTMLVGIGLAAFAAPAGAVARGLQVLRRELHVYLAAKLIVVVLAFTRFLSHPAGIAGTRDTLAGWWEIITVSSNQPMQLFILALLIYEPLAVLFAVVALARNDHREAIALFGGWFAAAFALWSFSAGRGPEHAIHVALPLILLAGTALGTLLHTIDWHDFWRGRGAPIALAMLGVVVGLTAVGILFSRANTGGGGFAAALPPVAVLCLVVVPLLYVIWRDATQHDSERRDRLPLAMALLVLALLLGAFGLRSATLLAFYRGQTGIELLAQQTATPGTLLSIERFLRLARDAGVADGSARDPTGSHSLSVALEADVRWPYVWYLREFPDLTVVPPGVAAATGAQVLIASSDAGFAGAGYAPQTWPWLNTVPPQYLAPDMADVLLGIVDPRRWLMTARYLLFRDGVALPPPAMVSVGLDAELAQRVSVRSGPFDLGERPGAGTEPGQFRDPIGIAVAPDGTIAVVDSGNARVQRFSRDGAFLGLWGDAESALAFTRTDSGLGPTGITMDSDGTAWIADTWGHRVVAIDANGNERLSIGGETVDLADDPARVDEDGGRFFGPRGIAVSDDAIYVTDTGNERVQVFSRDGEFVDAWGGYGSGPGQLIEPVGIAIGPDGNVYVADAGNARIVIFTPDGEPAGAWPMLDWPAAEPGGLPPAYQPYLAFDRDGMLYATASNAGQILVLDRNGNVVNRISEAGGERLAQPIGVAVAPDGEVLIADIGRDAVLTFTPFGAVGAGDLDFEDAGGSTEP